MCWIGEKVPLIISVIGANEPSTKIAQLAEQVGSELGKREVVLVCGGLGGVMEAACRGAKMAGGTTIGILPGSDPNTANPWVDIPICTGISYARNIIVVKTGRAVIAVGGAYGTLSEIAHALADNLPVVALDTWKFVRDGLEDSSMIKASTAVEAVELAVEAATARNHNSTVK